MRRLLITVALGVGLLAFVGPSRAFAFGGERVQADIPFAFHVDGRTLPAGQYVIRQNDILEPQVVTIQSRTTGREVLFLTDATYPMHSLETPELQFDTVGNQRFLHAILLPDSAGAVLRVSRSEVHAARVAAERNASVATASMGTGR
jgi:hypothetical protein